MNASYPIKNLRFGTIVQDSTRQVEQYYQELSFEKINTNVLIAPNFIGLGLPEYLWSQVINILYASEDGSNLNCVPGFSNGMGYCTLPKACYFYPELKNYNFRFQFEGQENILIVPLNVFVLVTSQGSCDLFI